jgi:hypothetical protein
MDPIERDAFNIIKGEQNGDEFIWDVEYEDDDGNPHVGAFKSVLKKLGLDDGDDDE